MRTLRYWFRLTIAFISRFKLLLFFGVLAGFFLFIILRFFIPRMVQSSTERIGITGRFHTEDLPEEVLNLVGQGLTTINENGEVVGALSEYWESNKEGTIWTFKIKNGLTWHDGTEVNASTINYSFKDVEIEKPDEYTIVFKLQSPFSPFPSAVAKPVFKKGFIGTGEWQINNISLAGEYVESITLVKKGLKKIYYFYPTEDLAKLAFKLGKVDILEDLLDPQEFEKWKNVTIKSSVNPTRYVAVFFNNDSDPFKGSKEMRQALSYAIDKKKLSENRAISPINPNSWAFNPQVKKYDYDREHALEILNDLGKEIIENTNIKLVTTPVLLEIAETIEKDWEAIGIDTTVQVSSAIPNEFQAFLAIYDIPKDPDQYAIWHSTQIANGTNISKFGNPRIDKLLEDGRLELNTEERKKIYLDFQRFLLEEAPAIFLYHPLSYTIIRK